MIKKAAKGSTSLGNALPHPGQHVREKYLAPKGLSVSAAAALVGVGRPAFSNFLNGNAALTPDMAARIDVAFGATKEELLAMQSAFDAAEAQTKGAPADATPYAAPFLNFKARDIEDWAERNIGARSRLAVLVRTLVNSTGRSITQVDFPGNDDAERPGWDGTVEAGQGTPWVPAGVSGWELGTNKDPKTKADGDIAKSIEAMMAMDVEGSTTMTPCLWIRGRSSLARGDTTTPGIMAPWMASKTFETNDEGSSPAKTANSTPSPIASPSDSPRRSTPRLVAAGTSMSGHAASTGASHRLSACSTDGAAQNVIVGSFTRLVPGRTARRGGPCRLSTDTKREFTGSGQVPRNDINSERTCSERSATTIALTVLCTSTARTSAVSISTGLCPPTPDQC